MTTSRQPWSTEQNAGSGKTWIKDASGRVIGVFDDWQDAELVLKCIGDPAYITRLEDRVEELRDDLAIATDRLHAAEEELSALEKERKSA